MPEHKTAEQQQSLASGAALDEYMYHLRNGVRAHAPCMPFKQIDTKFRPLALLEDQGLRRKAPAMAQTMTRPARDNSQKVGNSQEVKPTISTFGTFGRYTEIPLDQMTPEQRTGYDFEVKERGEVPGPHKIWLQNSKLLEIMVPVGTYFQESHSSLSDAEREIVVNLINGKWHAAYSTY